MPTEGVVQYAGVLDCMRMPAIEGLATLSWTLFYKGFVPSTVLIRAAAVQHNAARARTHTEYVRAQPAQRAEARARARAEFPKSIHTQASLKPFFAIPAGTPP